LQSAALLYYLQFDVCFVMIVAQWSLWRRW